MVDEVLNQSSDVNLSPADTSTPQEKMLRQSEVNDIVGRVRQEANAKLEEYKRAQEQVKQQAPERQQSSNQPSLNDDNVRRIIAEEAARYRNEAQAQADEQAAKRIVDNFYNKIDAGKQKYEDFEKVTGQVDLREFPNVVHMLSESIDNAHDVLYELSKDEDKLGLLEVLAQSKPKQALHGLRRVSESIRKNEEATGNRNANAPLTQNRPSNVGTDSGSVLSMRDLKAKYRA